MFFFIFLQKNVLLSTCTCARRKNIFVGDWTFGSSPHPQKCSLTCLQGHNEMELSAPEGIGRTLRSASSKTMTFGSKDITFWGPKVTDSCPEAQAQTPKPSVRRISPPPRRRWRTATRKRKLEDQDLREKSPRPGTMAAGRSLMEPTTQIPGGTRRLWWPSSTEDTWVKREYVRRSELYTFQMREKVGFVNLSSCNFTPEPAKGEL